MYRFKTRQELIKKQGEKHISEQMVGERLKCRVCTDFHFY